MFSTRRAQGVKPSKKDKQIKMEDDDDRAEAGYQQWGPSRSNETGAHPRLWSALGFFYLALGLLQILLSALWRWWFIGFLLGLGICKTGTSLIGLGLTGGAQPSLPPGASIKARLKHVFLSITFWGSQKIQKLIWYFRWPIFMYGGLVAMVIMIHLASPDPRLTSFPPSCPHDKRFGCSRIAEELPKASHGLLPMVIEAPLADLQAFSQQWIDSQANSKVLYSLPGFMHARMVTMLFGFADDFMVGLKCDGDGKTVVEVQGQLRIGKSDLGVNGRRNARFFAALETQSWTPGPCSAE